MFTIVADKDKLIKIAKDYNRFDECYVELYDDEENILNEDEFTTNLNNFLADIEYNCSPDVLNHIEEEMVKKKNGKLWKGRKVVKSQCKNAMYLCDFYPAWHYIELRFMAISDTEIELQVYSVSETDN